MPHEPTEQPDAAAEQLTPFPHEFAKFNAAMAEQPAEPASGEVDAGLHSSMDATAWTSEYCRINPSADYGMMLGWFANAIMAGYDEAMRRNESTVATLTRENGELRAELEAVKKKSAGE